MTVHQIEKFTVLENALKDIPFDGWTWAVFERAAVRCGYGDLGAEALFPRGIDDTLALFGQWADAKMLERLEARDVSAMRVHEKISLAVMERIRALTPVRECVRASAGLLASPARARLAAGMTWTTANVIWIWAGDTATDYNRYTKRGLLSGVLGTTMLYWLQDESDDFTKTEGFLNRRIRDVLFIGKNAAPIIKPVASLMERFIVRTRTTD